MGAVWGMGERYWKGDLNMRWKLFSALLESIVTYGAEIWGWIEQREMQQLITKYWRWVLGVRWNVPGYIIQQEVDEKQIWTQTWRRAYNYENRWKMEEGRIWIHIFAKWRNEEAQKGLRWRIERRKELEKLGISEEGIWDLERRGWVVTEEIERRIEVRRVVHNMQKIQSLRYNPRYKDLKPGQGRAQYLQRKEVLEKDKRLLASYRTGSEVGAANYWLDSEERLCKVCGEAEETLEHVVERCEGVGTRMQGKQLTQVLQEDGRSRLWLRELDKARKEYRISEREC